MSLRVDDGSGAGGAWLAIVADHEVLQDQVQAAVLGLIERRVLEKGNVTRPTDPFHFPQDAGGVAPEGCQVFTHAVALLRRAHSMAEGKGRNGTSVLGCG